MMNFKKATEVLVTKPFKMPTAGIVYSQVSESCYKVYTQLSNNEIVFSLEDAQNLQIIDEVNKAAFKNEIINIKNRIEKIDQKQFKSKQNERLNLYKMLVESQGTELANQAFKNAGWEIPS